MPAPVTQRQRARQSRGKNRNSRKWWASRPQSTLVTLRSEDKESSEKTAIVNLLHAIVALGEG